MNESDIALSVMLYNKQLSDVTSSHENGYYTSESSAYARVKSFLALDKYRELSRQRRFLAVSIYPSVKIKCLFYD